MFDIREDDLESQAVRELLAFHLSSMQAASPPEQAETPPAAQKKSAPRRPKQPNAPLSITPQR